MGAAPNQETVNDTAKLIMHRLVARALAQDPTLIERAKAAHARISSRFPDRSFTQEWKDLLDGPLAELRSRITSHDPDMKRLRLSSPFVIAGGIDFTSPTLRQRIWRSAKRLAMRAAPFARGPESSVGSAAA
jgi:hypothetical protein